MPPAPLVQCGRVLDQRAQDREAQLQGARTTAAAAATRHPAVTRLVTYTVNGSKTGSIPFFVGNQ
jgi:hypothetical protein